MYYLLYALVVWCINVLPTLVYSFLLEEEWSDSSSDEEP